MTDAGLWIGFVLAVAAATAMLSYMLWYQGTGRGMDARVVRRAVIQVWAAVVIGMAVGVGLRMVLGGGIIDLGRNPDTPLGVWVRKLRAHETVAVGVAMAAIAGCFVWALRAVRAVTGQAGRDGEGGRGERQ